MMMNNITLFYTSISIIKEDKRSPLYECLPIVDEKNAGSFYVYEIRIINIIMSVYTLSLSFLIRKLY